MALVQLEGLVLSNSTRIGVAIVVLGLQVLCAHAQEKTAWFTLTGDQVLTENNLIEIKPEPIGVDQRVMLELRVSRDRNRTSFRGQPYRSYYAKVVVDCSTRKAWYLWLSYHALPVWKGPAVAREEYKEGEAPVLFKDMAKEWSQRLISAACKTRSP